MAARTLIIVCDEKSIKHGDFLAQLVSRNFDKAGEVGMQYGAVEAQVWTENEYKQKKSPMSSSQFVLFIGNSKAFQEKRGNMERMYEKFGMNYTWLGRQAVLYVDRIVTLDEYEDFHELASSFEIKGVLKPQKLFERKSGLLPAPEEPQIQDIIIDEEPIDEECAAEETDVDGEEPKWSIIDGIVNKANDFSIDNLKKKLDTGKAKRKEKSKENKK